MMAASRPSNAPLMIAIIAFLTFVLLARGFRSVVLPIKAVLLNLLTLAATLGFMVAFWQFGHGSSVGQRAVPGPIVTSSVSMAALLTPRRRSTWSTSPS